MATTRPDREKFLRRLESTDSDKEEPSTPVAAGGKKTVRIDETPTHQEDETLEFLKQARLSSFPIDKSSLEALRGMFQNQNEDSKLDTPNEEDEAAPPLQEIQTNAFLLRRQPSDLTQNRFQRQSVSLEGDDWRTDATAPGSVEEKSQMANKMIMDQLETQTALLMEVQRQLDELKQSVKQLQQAAPQTIPTTEPVPRAAAVVVERGAVPIAAPPQGRLEHPPLYRILEICRVFWVMQRRQVNLDGGMFFKVIFMVMVLSGRMGRKKNDPATFWSRYRVYVGAVFVVLGFMMQSGYLKFLHDFFVKQNVPGRIWNGEDVEVDQGPGARGAAQRPRAAAAAAAANGEEQEGAPQDRQADNEEGRGWRDTFFGGVIPRPPEQNGDDENANGGGIGVFGVVQDIVYLLGSFVLSVLPMWKPEGPPPPPRLVEEEEQQEEEQEGEQHEGENAVPDQRDAMQPLEESDDEADNE